MNAIAGQLTMDGCSVFTELLNVSDPSFKSAGEAGRSCASESTDFESVSALALV